MPVILFPEQYDAWLDPNLRAGSGALHILTVPEDGTFYATAVSAYINNSRHEGPECIASPEEQ
jgi:putative SOS response-associated peptidase YedK